MKSLEQEGWILKPDISKTHTELLNTDLSHVGAKIIPADFASSTQLTGPKILQVKRVKDVSHSKISHENGSNKSMFRLTLSDGNSTCSAMNLQIIPGLSGKVYPGTKLRIKSCGAQVLGGFLLLTPGNCEILGGRVEKLVENIEKNENISKKKSGDGGPPKFVPFGSAGTVSLNLAQAKSSKQETIDLSSSRSANKNDNYDRNSRNDGKNHVRDQKNSNQRDRGGKGRGKGGQRNNDRGQNDRNDHKSNDERFNSKSRGNMSESRGSSRGNFHDKNRGNTRERDEEETQNSSRGRGRGSRGKDRSRRDDYSPPERRNPTGFSLGDMVQDFPALGGSSAPDSTPGKSTDNNHTGSGRSNSRGGGGSRGYDDRSRGNEDRSDRSRGRGKGSRGRGNNRSRRDDYSSGQNKPAGYKADLEADFPALGGSTPADDGSKSKTPVSKSKGYAQVDDEGFEIHDHLLYDDNGPPRQSHDPSFHHKQGYDSYRAGADIVDRVRDMSVSDKPSRYHGNDTRSGGYDRDKYYRGGTGKSQNYRRRDDDRGEDWGYRRDGGDSYQGRRDQRDERRYDRRGDDRYDQRYDSYDERYEQRLNDRYEQRYNDRYEQRYNDRYDQGQRYDNRYDQHYDDRRNDHSRGGRNAQSDRSNLSGNRGRSSGHYRRY